MEKAIILKLRDLLASGIDSECKSVYLLAETRKLLDSYPADNAPFGLKLYCHWALHIDLTKPGTTEAFLQQVDAFIESRQDRRKMDLGAENRAFRQLLLDSFREQLREFLVAYNLPTELCDKDDQWQVFLKHYSGVVEDGTLSCKSKEQRLKHVSEVVFGKARRSLAEANLPFYPSWRIVLLNGKSMTVNVKLGEPIEGKPSIVWSTTND
jgi:hypothetical protein